MVFLFLPPALLSEASVNRTLLMLLKGFTNCFPGSTALRGLVVSSSSLFLLDSWHCLLPSSEDFSLDVVFDSLLIEEPLQSDAAAACEKDWIIFFLSSGALILLLYFLLPFASLSWGLGHSNSE
jgi:hypothetical protein